MAIEQAFDDSESGPLFIRVVKTLLLPVTIWEMVRLKISYACSMQYMLLCKRALAYEVFPVLQTSLFHVKMLLCKHLSVYDSCRYTHDVLLTVCGVMSKEGHGITRLPQIL